MSFTPFIQILTDNKLNTDNFKDWKRKSAIVFSYEKQKFMLDEPCPPEPPHDALNG